MKTKHFIVAAISSYILFLLINAPASTVITMIEKSLPQIKIEGTSGTIWNGNAQRITYSNKYILDDAHWSICAWRLITGEACVELDAKYNDNDLHGEFGINANGTTKARNLKTSFNTTSLNNLISLPIGQLSGNVFLDIEYLAWTNSPVPLAKGSIKWNDAAITFSEQTGLGTVSIEIIESDEYPLSASINNSEGQIIINGHANINDDGAYALELKLLPNNNASTHLRKNLGMFTKKQSDGSYMVENSGNLHQLGII